MSGFHWERNSFFCRYRTVKLSNKIGNSYFTSLFVDNDLSYPKVSMTCNGFHLSRLLSFFFLKGWGGGWGEGGGLQGLESSRLCKYHVPDNVFYIWSAEAKNFAVMKKVKNKVRKVWTKAILHMSWTCKMYSHPFRLASGYARQIHLSSWMFD